MARLLSVTGVLLIIALMVGAPCWYKVEYDRRYRNFHVVEEGKLYRSGQLDLDALAQLVHQYGIRTIVDLRDGEKALDQAEEVWAAAAGVKHVRIPPRAWWTRDGHWPVPAEIGLAQFREIMRDPHNHPVLVHCWGGVHRTGLYCATYRMDFQHWPKPDAIAEMRALGYTILDQHSDVQAFLARYESPPCECAAAP
jgi:protein tyrosine/serine phosphatase